MKKIKLTQGKFALVNDDIFEYLNKWKWFTHKSRNTFYACRSVGDTGRQKNIKMHKVITGYKITDHINGNGLDNRQSNLRRSSHGQNRANSRLAKNNKTGFKGVCYKSNINKYHAQITYNKKCRHLGYFLTAKKASLAYKKAALKLHGKFARFK